MTLAVVARALSRTQKKLFSGFQYFIFFWLSLRVASRLLQDPASRCCPSCRTAMLLPLVVGQPVPEEELTQDQAKAAVLAGEEAMGVFTGAALGVFQALKGIFPRVPPPYRARWLSAFQHSCAKQVRRSAGETPPLAQPSSPSPS